MSARTIGLAHLTFLQRSPAELVELAAAAGFDAVSLRLSPATEDDDAGRRHSAPARIADARRACERTGVGVLDVEVFGFTPDTEPTAFLPALDAAAALGARYLLVNCRDADTRRFAERLARFADLAAGRGLRAMLEFIPYTAVRTLAQAAALVEGTDAGVLVDALHLQRSGAGPEDLARVGADRLGYVQLCDAPRVPPPGGLLAESRHDRLVPGTGELPLGDLLARFAPGAPVSVESPSDSLQSHLGELGLARRLRASVGGVLDELEVPRSRSHGKAQEAGNV
ncbi:MAG TPA: TIM barrel protein [Solirubrobacteraceae bacterium]|nr:TIM barrel protein [Solirubrobacteraceae bacterium]